uniref:Uncharacterized protein n=1 Tax=Leersia perrieri TaxID=77586 RepID=A0A0D9WNU6_9ORYZ
MGSYTNLDNNIMTMDYGELPEVDRLAFEAYAEDLRRKMLSCYRRTRQGVIKQEEFKLPVVNKSMVMTDSSKAPLNASEIVHMVDDAVVASLMNWFTSLSDTLDARMNDLENRLSSRLLGNAFTSYNSGHIYNVSSLIILHQLMYNTVGR